MNAFDHLSRARRAEVNFTRARGDVPSPKPGETAGMGADEIDEVIQLLDAGKVGDARRLLVTYAGHAKDASPKSAPPAEIGPATRAAARARRADASPASLRAEGFDARFIDLYEQTAAHDPRNAEALLTGARARRAQSRA